MNFAHARSILEAWRNEYNEERPKNALGGLSPAAYEAAAGQSTTGVLGLYT
ncbi:MAG: integrase core domain-containing protein [Nitrospira sp.]|nr:integrase core domain-containing protein [Nitrospira sp.]